MTSRSASKHENPIGITVSISKGLLQRGWGHIEISVSGEATAEEFQELLGSSSIYGQFSEPGLYKCTHAHMHTQT